MKYACRYVLASLLLQLAVDAAGAAEQVTVENGKISVTLSTQAHGAVVSLRDVVGDRELAAKSMSPRLFLLELSQRNDPEGKPIYVASDEAKEVELLAEGDGPNKGARVAFRDLAGRGIDAACTVKAAEGEAWLRWRIEVQVPEGLVLEQVHFPIVTLRTPTETEPDDAIVIGATKGGVYRRPAAWKPGRSIQMTQPGSLTAQFGCYYDPRGGFMTAAFDSRGYRKAIRATRTNDGVALAWLHPCFQTGKYSLHFDVVQTVFASDDPGRPADWRDAADLYKSWAVQQPWCARKYADRDDLPGWLKEGPAMVRFSRSWLAEPERIERWLTEYWQKDFPAGTPLIIAYWGWEKVDTWITPDYFPVFPSDEVFQKLTRLGKSLGGHAFLWPSGYHYTLTHRKQPDGSFFWDDRERFDATARQHAVCNRDGQVRLRTPSWLQGGQCVTMCPGDPWTIDWLNQIAVEIVRRGADMVQVDQVVGGNFPACYSTGHGHEPGPGLWCTDAFRKQLETMLKACREVDPEAVVCFEEPNEWFIQQVGIQDYRDWEVMRRDLAEPASVFSYIYHEYLPTFQSNPQPGNRLQAAYCLANGQIPHLAPSQVRGPGPALDNGAMETWSEDAPNGWDKVAGYRGRAYAGRANHDKQQFHGGEASLRLSNDQADEMVQVSQNVRIGGGFQVGRTYRLSAWMKSEGLQQANGIGLATFTDQMKATGSWRIAIPQGAGDWQRGEATFTVPEGTRLLRIMIHVNGPGTVWIDDVALDEVAADGTTTPAARPDKPIDHQLMHQWVTLFHGEGRPYLLLGKMLHPPKLETATQEYQGRQFAAILHNAFEGADGSQAVVVVNATDVPQTGRLHWRGKEQTISLEPWEVRLVR